MLKSKPVARLPADVRRITDRSCAWCHTVPTKLTRIAVVRDAVLEAALDSMPGLNGGERPAAAQVHDLALMGLELDDMACSENPPWDLEVRRDIDRLVWGHP